MPTNPMDIETLLPHRGPMLMITDIIGIDQEKAVTRSQVARSWPLSDQLGVSCLILIELAAQTAGIYNSFEVVKREGTDSQVRGWIVGIKKARFKVDHLPFGTWIETTANNQFEYEQLREIHGIARVGDRVVGEITLQLMRAQ